MTFRQTYYTSCQHGLRGGKGFQINAATEGIDPSVLQQVERLGLYVPPVSAPSRPTPEEIERFPVSLLFQRLSDGTAVLAQARYTGADYSGRFGNYFTHSLISADLEHDMKEEGLLPVELWGGGVWTTSESATTSLPALSRLEAGGLVDPERVAEFLSAGDRLRHLPSFLTAVEGALLTGRRIIMVDDAASVALWLSAASYALPQHLALRLTFNTYVKNPYQSDFLLVGTTPDSDFGFAPHEVEHQFYVFDFERARLTPIPEITPFARMSASAYAGGHVHAIAQFSAFVERVAPDLAVEELDAAFACHARRAGFEPPGVDDVRVLGWCARRINGFDTTELRELVTSVAARDVSRGEILDAYTDLYLAALHPSTRPDTRRLIELPYLEWLIRTAAGDAPLASLERAAQCLLVEPSSRSETASLLLSWVKQVRQCTDIRRFPALFEIADKVGVFSTQDDVLRLVGEELIGPSLSVPPVRDVLSRYAARPGMRSVFDGAGSYLATQIGNPEAFGRLGEVLSPDEIYRPLVRYAFEQQSPALYFRLVGARLPRVAANNPQQRLDAFMECIAGVKRMTGGVVAPELADNAYDAIWQHALPSFDEAIGLLDLLESSDIKNSGIPKQLIDLVATCAVTAQDARQQQLLERLGARRPVYDTLGEKRPIVDAYRIPAELESSGEELPQEIEASIDFLERHPELGSVLIEEVCSIIAKYLTRVKEAEQHAALLVRAYKHVGGPNFLEAYERAVVASLDKPSPTRPKVAVRYVRIGLFAARAGANIIAARIFEKSLPEALGKWRAKEYREVESELADNPPALRRWLQSLEIAESENRSSVKEFFGKFIGFNRGGPEKR